MERNLSNRNTHWLLISIITLSGVFYPSHSQHQYDRYNSLDVLSYRFELDLNDSSDMIRAAATLIVHFKQPLDSFRLDLASHRENGKGMTVTGVTEKDRPILYRHDNDQLIIRTFKAPFSPEAVGIFKIYYRGIPSDGLIISTNQFGDRTFFGDNWPNRAHHWLPVVDHPSDKAYVEFLVEAPLHYQIVSNGLRIGGYHMDQRVFSHWRSFRPLPAKLMVIGVSPFAVDRFESSSGVPLSSWVFPQNRENGFYDYRIAERPVRFFEGYIAPFPYSKLANVQSRTIYGGMENASCIFYREGSVTGRRENESLFAHEIAHQWFGDAVTEGNWNHIWLSEGFATYFTDLYLEYTYGTERFLESLQDERSQVIRYSYKRLAPVVDSTPEVSRELLSPNSYEKGAWVLHMLRRELGDSLFRKSIRSYYRNYRHGNALTEDFTRTVREVSGRDLDPFFYQWLFEPGHPLISAQWSSRGKAVELVIRQQQQLPIPLFKFPLEIEWNHKKGGVHRETIQVSEREQRYAFTLPFRPHSLKLDPDCWLLFEPDGSSPPDKRPRRRTSSP